MSAFTRLSTNRQLGFGVVGPIPSDKIWKFCDRQGMTFEQAEFFEAVIMLADQDTLARQRTPDPPGDKKRRGK